ncbi:nitrate reductase molybdenum cofactor assembly chaperone [Zooshikella marina]|uniref:nitrate reductase molybdenum cofactor assembly chaperone n=1 Tax=Zooshikella ganghwensis TaxID=202772 RepID=UPI001BB007EF|nr:nitrate reductase molybdenum cofactor assembly chaperone [Zooshikella ganghwensis]MBU2705585.1 nitrate reductase molybdenum cofactor assembly chaperone [Zooshikella ganghwensis]
MKSLIIIARLLDYPTQDIASSMDEVHQIILQDIALDEKTKQHVLSFIEHYSPYSLLDWQSEYEGLFDRSRSLSLHLFEHTYGESRDRGQAMVNLLDQYHQAGLELNKQELPDFLPLYLEFVSTQGISQATEWLHDIAHILSLLAARLQQRNSPYHLLFKALLTFAHVSVDLTAMRAQIADEAKDDTPEAIDKVWEEEAISFGHQDALSSVANHTQTNHCAHTQFRPSEAQRKDHYLAVNWQQNRSPLSTKSVAKTAEGEQP